MLFLIVYYLIISRPYAGVLRDVEKIENDLLDVAQDINTSVTESTPFLNDANRVIRDLGEFSDDLYPFYCRLLAADNIVNGVPVPENCFKDSIM